MTSSILPRGSVRACIAAASLAIAAAGCDDGGGSHEDDTLPQLETTRLCPIVPARDPAAAAFPPEPPASAFGTDLGWTYERDGILTILFGDTWQRIDICPLQPNDDSMATIEIPPDDWPGFTADASIPDERCPQLTFFNDAAGTSFAPIVLTRWDGVPIPLIPLNTPVAAFHDGEKEWAVFIVAGGQACSESEAAAGSPCPDDLSPQAADLVCGFVDAQPRCLDPTSTRQGDGRLAYYLHIGERVGPTSYISRAMFLTNKYLNLTLRAVQAFDPDDPRRRDYEPGTNALLLWGRPGFNDLDGGGELPPYFMYHELPFEEAGDRIVFEPRYFRGLSDDGEPSYGTDQADAAPLYTGEFSPVNHMALSYVSSLSRWLMIYGGAVTDFQDPDDTAEDSQPVPGALYARFAPEAWGPWTDAQVILTEEDVAQDFVCGKRAPVGCLPPPDPLIRPECLEIVDPLGGGNLYGANIIDTYTRSRKRDEADVFWLVSTWHPYSVVLIKTRIELD